MGADRAHPPRDFATARRASVGLEHSRSIAKAFVARGRAAQVAAGQLDQVEGVQEQAAVVAAGENSARHCHRSGAYPLPQVTAAQELQIKAEARLASLMEEKLVTRISVLSTLLGGGKTTERLLVRISIETHKTSPDFNQTVADKAKNRIMQALGEIDCDVFIETDR